MAVLPIVGGFAQDAAGSAAAPVLLGASLYFLIIGLLWAFRLAQRRAVALAA